MDKYRKTSPQTRHFASYQNFVKIFILFLLPAIYGFSPGIAAFDIGLILPPGTSDESISTYTPTRRSYIETKTRNEEEDYHGTEVISNLPLSVPFSGNFTELVNIQGVDLVGELQWYDHFKIGNDPVASSLKYEPYDSIRSRFEGRLKCIYLLLTKFFYNNKTSDLEDAYYLTLFGDATASHALNMRIFNGTKLREFCDEALSYISTTQGVPSIPNPQSSFENMMYKLVIRELTCYYPFTSGPFAPELDNFSREQIYPYITACLNNSNKRLKRNAVYYLGLIGKYNELFEILKSTKDNVEKLRALYFLTKAKYNKLSSYLIEILPKEKSPVFKIAIINSLRKLGDMKAFQTLVQTLDRTNDYELAFALIKACINCMDDSRKDLRSKLMDKCKSLKNIRWQDPEIPFQNYKNTVNYIEGYRHKAMGQLTTIALAICGNKASYDKIMEDIEAMYRDLDRQKGFFADQNSEYLFSRYYSYYAEQYFCNNVMLFLVSILHKIKDGKFILDKIISLKGMGENRIFNTAIDLYYNAYPGEFVSWIESLSTKELLHVFNHQTTSKILQQFERFAPSDKSQKLLNAIVNAYNVSLSAEAKNIVAYSIILLGMKNKISDDVLINIIKKEMTLSVKRPPLSADLNPLQATLYPETKLLEIAIEMLGKIKSPAAEQLLTEINSADEEISRAIARALRYFNSEEVKETLIKYLSNNDPWTRLIAYLSLENISSKQHRVDWFYSSDDALKKEGKAYVKILKNLQINIVQKENIEPDNDITQNEIITNQADDKPDDPVKETEGSSNTNIVVVAKEKQQRTAKLSEYTEDGSAMIGSITYQYNYDGNLESVIQRDVNGTVAGIINGELYDIHLKFTLGCCFYDKIFSYPVHKFEYNEKQQLIKWLMCDASQISKIEITFEYDTSNNLIKDHLKSDAEEHHCTYIYTNNYITTKLTEISKSAASKWTFEYDENLRLSSVTQYQNSSDGTEKQLKRRVFSYNSAGRVACYEISKHDKYIMLYDDEGNIETCVLGQNGYVTKEIKFEPAAKTN